MQNWRYNLDMRDFIVMGLGELGALYANAALKLGLRVTPVTRALEPERALQELPLETPLLVAVGEADLESALTSLPKGRLDSLVLLQNELFPAQWERFTSYPTVMVPWLLKKKGEPLLVARSTPVLGQHADLVLSLHRALGFEAEKLPDEAALRQAIVDKYAFILTVNALGLLEDLALGDWLHKAPAQVSTLAREAAALGARLVCEGRELDDFDTNTTVTQVQAGMKAMGAMRARGRTAKERLRRATAHAARFGVPVPALDQAARS
jgi:hypothetical protein